MSAWDDEEGLDGPDLAEADMGEPVTELRQLEEVPDAGFLGRLVHSLHRRRLGSQLVVLGWSGLAAVLREFLQLVFSAFDTHPPDQGGSN